MVHMAGSVIADPRSHALKQEFQVFQCSIQFGLDLLYSLASHQSEILQIDKQ